MAHLILCRYLWQFSSPLLFFFLPWSAWDYKVNTVILALLPTSSILLAHYCSAPPGQFISDFGLIQSYLSAPKEISTTQYWICWLSLLKLVVFSLCWYFINARQVYNLSMVSSIFSKSAGSDEKALSYLLNSSSCSLLKITLFVTLQSHDQTLTSSVFMLTNGLY